MYNPLNVFLEVGSMTMDIYLTNTLQFDRREIALAYAHSLGTLLRSVCIWADSDSYFKRRINKGV